MIYRTLTIWLLLASLCLAQTKVLVIEGRPKADVEKSYGLVRGTGNGASNHTKFNAELADRTNLYPPFFPAGYWAVADTIELPQRTSFILQGTGWTRNFTNDSVYDDSVGGPAARLVWEGAADGTMIEVPGNSITIKDLSLFGLPEPADSFNQAGVGIHYLAESGAIPPNTSELVIERVSFIDQTVGILCGHDRTGAGTEAYTGEDYNHADNVTARNILFRGQDYCYWMRNNQSVCHHISNVKFSAGSGDDPDDAFGRPTLFRFERGGKFWLDGLEMLGNGTVLRVDESTSNNLTFHLANISTDATTDNVTLFKKDTNYVDNANRQTFVTIDNVYLPVDQVENMHVIEAQGTGAVIVLRGVQNLQPGALKVSGEHFVGGNRKLICSVRLENCTMIGCTSPADLFYVDAGFTAELYELTWSNCYSVSYADPDDSDSYIYRRFTDDFLPSPGPDFTTLPEPE